MPQGLVKPSNAILYAGDPLYQELTAEGSGIKPGRLLITGSAETQCKVATEAGVATVIGVADIEATERRQTTTGADPDNATAYTAGDQVRVLRGDVVVMLVAGSGETINRGTRLEASGGGIVIASTTGVNVVGYALTAKPTNGGNDNEWILGKLTI